MSSSFVQERGRRSCMEAPETPIGPMFQRRSGAPLRLEARSLRQQYDFIQLVDRASRANSAVSTASLAVKQPAVWVNIQTAILKQLIDVL